MRTAFALAVAFLPAVALLLGSVVAARTKAYAPVARWWLKSTALFLVGLLVSAAGLFAVAIGIPFRRIEPDTTVSFSDPRFGHLGTWVRERLPVWLLPWDNAYDGLNGDKRGWFANWCLDRKIPYPSFWARWIWAAWRNPANYWSRNTTGCNVTGSAVETILGPDLVDEDNPGFHFQILTDANGRRFEVLELCRPWPFAPSHAVYARFGWKIKPEHAGTPIDARPQDQMKGTVYRCSFWKDIS